jgi:CRISPR/Cas system-associated endonuclease Cas3-HD
MILDYMQRSTEHIREIIFQKTFIRFVEFDYSKLLENENGLVPNTIDEDIIIKVLETFPKGILYFKKSSEAMQMAVAKSNPDCIKYIQNPCDKVKGLSVFL